MPRLKQKQIRSLTIPKVPSRFTPKRPTPFVLPRLKRKPSPRGRQPTYGVQVRRFGVFKPIAKGLTFAQAVEVGKTRAGRTLAATFKLTPEFGKAARGLRTPKGFRRKPTKTGIEFIERRRFRLSTRPETKEIQFFQKRKPRKKKKLKGGKKK